MRVSLLLGIVVFAIVSIGGAAEKKPNNPHILLETTQGKVVIELFQDKAPITVKNFLNYSKAGFYNGTVFHRVIPGFMIQGGGFLPDMERKEAGVPIWNEADNGLKNDRGTIAMARTSRPHSATAQFFINTVDNNFLDHKGKTSQGWGYAVFGKVIDGIEVVDRISKVKRGNRGRFQDVPLEPVVIVKAAEVQAKDLE